MNFRVIGALVLRYIFLYMRSPMRLIELLFWPVVDLMVWGNLTLYIQHQNSASNPDFSSRS